MITFILKGDQLEVCNQNDGQYTLLHVAINRNYLHKWIDFMKSIAKKEDCIFQMETDDRSDFRVCYYVELNQVHLYFSLINRDGNIYTMNKYVYNGKDCLFKV